MSYFHDQDTIDEYRKPEYHGEFLSHDDAVTRYENDSDEFAVDAMEAFCNTDEIPEALRALIADWYRKTEQYERAVQNVIDAAQRPY